MRSPSARGAEEKDGIQPAANGNGQAPPSGAEQDAEQVSAEAGATAPPEAEEHGLERPAKKGVKPDRHRRFSKRVRMLMALGVLVAVAGAFVLLLPTIKTRFPSELATSMDREKTSKTLETGNTKVLDSITVTHDDGETYTLLYRNEELYLQRSDDEIEMINESYTDEIVAAATEIAVTDTVAENESEVSEHLADMGLQPPKITVNVGYLNGETVEIQVGDEVPGTTYYYYRWSGDDGVYMCDVGIHDAFTYTEHMLLPVTQPSLVPVLTDRLSIDTKSAGRMVCDFVADGTDSYLGTLREPYVYPMDSDSTATLLKSLENFRLGTKMDTVTAENRTEYGFDDPTAVMDVHQKAGLYSQVGSDGALQWLTAEEQTIRLTFGAKDGDFFYFCEYAGECYRVSSFLVTTLVSADANDYLSRAPADMGSAAIASISMQMGGGSAEVRATYTERVLANNDIETDSEGNTVYDVTVTLNGDAITTDAFNSLVERLKAMTVSGKLDAVQTPAGTPRWQMTLTTTGGASRTLAAYPKDAFNDVLAVDGVALYYLNAEAIQIALAEMYPGS
ncbi:MAG: DUF4340 domain-containing protein [Eubacteriales bacterium]|nr:DUF4340 domain-containing protein [Eubacteriales bacterium]